MHSSFTQTVKTAFAAMLLFALTLTWVTPVNAAPESNPSNPSYSQPSTTQNQQSIAGTSSVANLAQPALQFAQTPDGPPAFNPEETSQQSSDQQLQPKSCEASVPGLGWLICNIGDLLYGTLDWLLHDVLEESLLKIDLIDDEENLKEAWSGFKTIANLVFVVAFLILIYAEATGRFGALEAYSLPRLLPRIAVAVIGIQLSYFIMAYLIALFNDLGEGVGRLALLPVANDSRFEIGDLFGAGITSLFGEGIAQGAAGVAFDNVMFALLGGALVLGAVVFFETVLLFGILGLLLVVLTLIARKVIIIALVIMAPVAFAAYVLPSTEKLFKLWWDTFIKALAMYPLIILFIAAGQLVARLAVSGSDPNFIDSMIGLVAAFMPFFLIPVTFKLGGAAVRTVGNAIAGMNTRLKGDLRDPNSLRSNLRQRRGSRYSRMMNGQVSMPLTNKAKPLVPKNIRKAYNRLPGVDSSAPMIADIASGREAIKNLTSTLGDDFPRAMAVTGGGRKKGDTVRTADGTFNSGVMKFGKHLAYDQYGRVMTNDRGYALLRNDDGTTKEATGGDFYDGEIMSQVRKFSNNRGIQHASGEYAMTKAQSLRDQAQVWEGLDSTRWTADEKQILANSIWYNTKGDNMHNKFADFGGYFHDGTYDVSGQHRQIDYKFDKMIDYMSTNEGQFEMSKQKGAFWEVMSEGLEEYAGAKGLEDVRNLSDTEIEQMQQQMAQPVSEGGLGEQFHQIADMAHKAASFAYSERQMRGGSQQPVLDDEGEPTGSVSFSTGSQATGRAARKAEEFLLTYEKYFRRLPSSSGVTDRIQPGGRNPRQGQ